MEQYYFTFYCDELCVTWMCELEYEEAEPEVGLKDSMTLVSAIPKSALGDGTSSGLDILGIMKLSLVDEIEAAALKDIHDTEMDF
jgi:hypothetical protein